MKDDSPEHHTHMLMGRMVLNNVIVPPAPENPMNAELREAVERVRKWLLRPPAALRSMYRGNARKSYADEAHELAESLEAVTQALRDQEAEIARLQNVADGNAELYQHELLRSEKAEALLRECVENREGLAYETDLLTRITAHLGGENNG